MQGKQLRQLESELWRAADQLRANSKLTASEYSMPVLGLIFLRHAYNRFLKVKVEVEKDIPVHPQRGKRPLTKKDFEEKNSMFLPDKAQFDYLVSLPEGADIGDAIDNAMKLIEDEYENLKGVLPKNYSIFSKDLLKELLRIFNKEVLQKAEGDLFGKIYEYFLNKFAMTGAQEGGEFFTPMSLVQTIVNVIEPDHGIVFDPACGSAGMFVQTGYFIESEGLQPAEKVTFYGQEKAELNTKLSKMNLTVHGLEGNILEGNTFYEDKHNLLHGCDFVMANPPFNVDGVDKGKDSVKKDPRLMFGDNKVNLPKNDNANYLWIQYFYNYLKPPSLVAAPPSTSSGGASTSSGGASTSSGGASTSSGGASTSAEHPVQVKPAPEPVEGAVSGGGCAGFVMASSANDAGHSEKEIREKLVRTGAVDVMMAIGNNFFYTRSLPCTLWFFDRSKEQLPYPEGEGPGVRWKDTVLMLDARKIYRKVTSKVNDFSPEQLQNLICIVNLYRGKKEKFETTVKRYLETTWELAGQTAEATLALQKQFQMVHRMVNDFATQYIKENKDTLAFADALVFEETSTLKEQQDELIRISKLAAPDLETIALACRNIRKPQDKLIKQLLDAISNAVKDLQLNKNKDWKDLAIKDQLDQLKALQQQLSGNPDEEEPGLLHETEYFWKQAHWLQSRFPAGAYTDVEGLCKVVTLTEIESKEWSLSPGRYVGVDAAVDDGIDYEERLREIHIELEGLNEEATKLAVLINENIKTLIG